MLPDLVIQFLVGHEREVNITNSQKKSLGNADLNVNKLTLLPLRSSRVIEYQHRSCLRSEIILYTQTKSFLLIGVN